jgi:protein SMG7
MVERGNRVDDDPNLLLAQAEKLLASIKEAAKLDNSVTFQELSFSRTKLRDIYRSLLLVNLEISLDKKIEQELWNQCYKSPISQLQEQQKSKSIKPELRQEAALNLSELLEQAYGFYLRLLDEICEAYALEINSRASEKQLKMINTMDTNVKEKPRSASSNYIAQHCLVHLGDIARYRHKSSMADSYYRKAAQIVPSNGQPYNQLAILASPQSDMLSTVFFYLRAINVKCPFPGSKLNLERTLEKVLKNSNRQSSKASSKLQTNKISVLELLRLFLKFHAIIYTQAEADIDQAEFGELYS